MKTNVLFLIVGVAGALLLSVLADRTAGWYMSANGYVKALPPGLTVRYDTSEFSAVATISAQGIRNSMVAIPKLASTRRILVIGDSFTYGWGVSPEQTWVQMLEGKLTGPDKRVEVINAGLPGAGLSAELLLCRAYKAEFDPDYIVIALYADDWLEPPVTRWQHMVSTIWPTIGLIAHPVIGWNHWEGWEKQGPVVSSEFWKVKAAQNLANNPRILLTLDPAIRSDYVAGKINPGVVSVALDNPQALMLPLIPVQFGQALDRVGDRLLAMRRACTGSVPTTVLFLPSEELVSEDYHAYRKALGYDVDPQLANVDIDTPLGSVVARAGFRFVSTSAFLRADGCSGCYFPYDEHLTPVGNQRVVDAILPTLREWLAR